MELSDAELLKRVTAEWQRNKGNYFTMSLTSQEAMQLLGALQLAVRHPGLPNSIKLDLLKQAFSLEEFLMAGGPATAELCRRGWAPEHDFIEEDG